MINLAIDQVVDGTDPRLRAVSGYRKRLRPAVIKAVNNTLKLVDGLAPPIELSRKSFSREDCIRAVFSSPDHISDFLSRCQVLHNHLKKQTGVALDNIHALLLVLRNERNVLGLELDKDIIRRDVPQVSINFSNPRLISPMNSESASRRETNKQVFDFFIVLALKKLLAARNKQSKDHFQYEILAKKLKTLESANWSIEGLLNQEQEHLIDRKKLDKEFAELATELKESVTEPITLEHYLKVISETLIAAPDLLRRMNIKIKMDRMGKKLEDEVGPSVLNLELDELCSYDGRRLIALPVYIPFTEIPARPDFLTEASRYL
ncbi:MAG: hypothetical protein ABFS39_14880 [Pseudomonadota bacterium]